MSTLEEEQSPFPLEDLFSDREFPLIEPSRLQLEIVEWHGEPELITKVIGIFYLPKLAIKLELGARIKDQDSVNFELAKLQQTNYESIKHEYEAKNPWFIGFFDTFIKAHNDYLIFSIQCNHSLKISSSSSSSSSSVKRSALEAELPQRFNQLIIGPSIELMEHVQYEMMFQWREKFVYIKSFSKNDLDEISDQYSSSEIESVGEGGGGGGGGGGGVHTVLLAAFFIPFVFKQMMEMPSDINILNFHYPIGVGDISSSSPISVLSVTRDDEFIALNEMINTLAIMTNIYSQVWKPNNSQDPSFVKRVSATTFKLGGMSTEQAIIRLIKKDIVNYKFGQAMIDQLTSDTNITNNISKKKEEEMSFKLQLIDYKNDDDENENLDKFEKNEEQVGGMMMGKAANFFRNMVGAPPKFYEISSYDPVYLKNSIIYDEAKFNCHKICHRRGLLNVQLQSKCTGKIINDISTEVIPGLYMEKCDKPRALIYRYRLPNSNRMAMYSSQLGTLNAKIKLNLGQDKHCCPREYGCCGIVDLKSGHCPSKIYSLSYCGAECRLQFKQSCVTYQDKCNPCKQIKENIYFLKSVTVILPHC